MANNVSHRQSEAPVADYIWSDLNYDITESILKRLPTESFARFRRVCKDWNNLLSSQHFLTWRREIFKEQPWLLIISDRSNCYRLNVVTKEVKAFPIRREMLGTVGGLILLSTDWPRNILDNFLYNPLNETRTPIQDVNITREDFINHCIIVCNPRTETFVELPLMRLHRMHGTTVGDILWRGEQCQVVVVYETTIDVYDRSKQLWVTVQRQLPRRIPRKLVFFKGLFFCMMIIPNLTGQDELMVFRIKEDYTCQMVSLSLPMPISHLQMPPLMLVCGTTLFLGTQDPLCLYLWELEYDNNLNTSSNLFSWKPIGMMPQEMFDFSTAGLDRANIPAFYPFKPLVVGKYICFARIRGKNIVFFNTENQSWSRFSAVDNVKNLSYVANVEVLELRPDLVLQ